MTVMPARNYIELVEKTMRVLEAIADADRSLALSEIANRVALVKSSTFRILFTLSEIGYVEKVDGNGAYAATPRLKALARVPASHTSFLSVARARLQEVSRKLHESAWLAEWRNGSFVMVDVAEVSHALRLSLNVGDPCPLHASALGKAIAAHLSPDELRSMLGSGRLPRFTGRTISNRSARGAPVAGARDRVFGKRGRNDPGGAGHRSSGVRFRRSRVCRCQRDGSDGAVLGVKT